MILPSFSKITGCTYPVLNTALHEMLQMVALFVYTYTMGATGGVEVLCHIFGTLAPDGG